MDIFQSNIIERAPKDNQVAIKTITRKFLNLDSILLVCSKLDTSFHCCMSSLP